MNWKYRAKRLLTDRFSLTAVLFLCLTFAIALSALWSGLSSNSACAGYRVPQPVKSDPTLPRRTQTAVVPAVSLSTPSKTPLTPTSSAPLTAQTAGDTVTHALEDQHGLIELYGALQRLTGRTVVEDPADNQYTVVRLEEGTLTFTGVGTPDPQAQAAHLKRLQLALDRRNVSLLYAQAPAKLTSDTPLPYGVEDTSNACADRLLAALEEGGVDCLDLRRALREAEGDWSGWFYRTDHHWTQQAAFLAFQALVQRLETYSQTVAVSNGSKQVPIRIPDRYTDPDSYETDTLPRFFLGSQGKRVGSSFVGTDDFPLCTPVFPTLLHYQALSADLDAYGDAAETVLFPQRVERRDYYGGNPYTYYAGGDYPFARITNYYNSQGPRVLLIRDSFACAVTPYLAYATSELYTIDPRYFSGDLLTYVDWLKPDVVVILYSSGMVRSEEYYRLLPETGLSKKQIRFQTEKWTPQE